MLRQRVITALITFPLAMIPFLLGQTWLVRVFFTGCVGLATFEVAKMLVPRLEAVFRSGSVDAGRSDAGTLWLILLGVVLSGAVFIGATAVHSDSRAIGIVALGLLSAVLFGCFLAPNNDLAFARVTGLLISVAYGTLPWLSIWQLYNLGAHSGYVILLLAVVWGGDTGAYFGGIRWGRIKLAPRMSPKKTLEGALCGIVASMVLGSLTNLIWGLSLGSWSVIALVSFFGGIFGQLGDLVESTFKRFALVKDSGNIFPGHGGFLDRVDGLLFAAPVVWFILYIMSS